MAAAAGEELPQRVRDQTYVMLRGVRNTIEQNYYDPTFGGLDLGARAEVAQGRIAKATSIGDAFAAIAQFELELDDSHTLFLPPRQTIAVDYGWNMRVIGEACYVVRVNEKSDAAHQGVAPGDRVRALNGFQPNRENLWRLEYMFNVLRPQPGLHVELLTPSGVARELNLAAEVRKQKRTLDITGRSDSGDIWRVNEAGEKEAQSRQPTVVEVGDVTIFRMPTFFVEKSLIEQILRRSRGHAALILDLRGNHGGPVDILLYLLGGLASVDVSIGSRRERNRTEPLIAKGTGDNAFAGRLLVLVDSESASSSELLARTVQLTRRGTVIGERTAGGVMLSREWHLQVSSGDSVIIYGTRVAVADFIMSDGARLEKAGVVPELTVVPTAEDLASGRDPVLARALTIAGKPIDAARAAALLRAN